MNEKINSMEELFQSVTDMKRENTTLRCSPGLLKFVHTAR